MATNPATSAGRMATRKPASVASTHSHHNFIPDMDDLLMMMSSPVDIKQKKGKGQQLPPIVIYNIQEKSVKNNHEIGESKMKKILPFYLALALALLACKTLMPGAAPAGMPIPVATSEIEATAFNAGP